ncbi:hypothetical protein ACFP1H_08895 [Secundilactobacillus hailunensis]|uniref:Uncharacterized protein n=1 Tax=Secundilactobacillus hailunensis TaxID=2559923 RepID=A0ABW1TAP2_9LACO|nr:hypothetical protein [Secundilactobacillus hailunensis]
MHPELITEDQAWDLIQTKIASATAEQRQQIQQKIKSSMNIEKNGDETVATFSDISIENAYISVLDPSALIVSARKTGTSKIVWHGAAKKGNLDLYLSAGMLNKLKKGSISAGVGIVMTALLYAAGGPAGGFAAASLNAALKFVVGAVIKENIKHFKAGRIMKIRNWKYKGMSYQ